MSVSSQRIAVTIRRIFSIILQLSGLMLVAISGVGVLDAYAQSDPLSAYILPAATGTVVFLMGLFFQPPLLPRYGTAASSPAIMMAGGRRYAGELLSHSEMRHRTLLSKTDGIPPEIYDEVIALSHDTSSDEEVIALARRISAELATNRLTAERVRAHEAAHAVVAHVLGHTITSVTINDLTINAIGGTVNWISLRTLPAVDSAFRGMHAAAAGWTLDLMEGDHHPGSSGDIAAMHNFASMVLSTGQRPTGYHGPMDRDALVSDVIERTRSLLIETTGAQKTLVTALPRTGTLSGRKTHEILRTALPNIPRAAEELLGSPSSDAIRSIDPEGSPRHTTP